MHTHAGSTLHNSVTFDLLTLGSMHTIEYTVCVAYRVWVKAYNSSRFYHAMHYSAKCGIAIACRLSVRLSVTLVDHDHIG